MAAGIRFYKVVWALESGGLIQSTEAAHSRRYLADQIRKGEVSPAEPGTMVKIQEIETPVIEIQWLLDLFTTAGTKKNREEHKEQAAYILRLVETCAARVMMETGKLIER